MTVRTRLAPSPTGYLYFYLWAQDNNGILWSKLKMLVPSGKKNGQVLWLLRIALSGEEFSPGAFELAYILGKDTSRKRIHSYL